MSKNAELTDAVFEVHTYNPFSWKTSAGRIAATNPELFIYSNWHPFFAASTISIIKTLKKKHPDLKTAGLLHNVIPHERFPLQNKLNRGLFSLTDFPVVLSSQTRREFEQLDIGNQPVQLFHPVYEQDFPRTARDDIKQKYNIQSGEKTILFFGLVRKYKGLDILIQALNELNLEELNIRPVIVGEFYIPKKPILDLIRSEHRSRYIIIDSFVSDEAAAEILSVSDVMALPYLTASQSGVLSNAVNFNLPVICSNLPGLTDHIIDGENGIIFKTGDPSDMKQKLFNYFTNDMKEQMSLKMKQLKKELSWETFVEKFLITTKS
ncbi:MAG: glycosyltransferase [Balneolales bacterium]